MLASLSGVLRGFYINVTAVGVCGGGPRTGLVQPACLSVSLISNQCLHPLACFYYPCCAIRGAAAAAPPELSVQPGLMFKHVGVPRRLIYATLIFAPTGSSSEPDSGASLSLDSGNCNCRLLSRLLCRKLNA